MNKKLLTITAAIIFIVLAVALFLVFKKEAGTDDVRVGECNLAGGEWIKRWDTCNLTDKTCTDSSQCEDVRDFIDKPESSDVSIYCIGKDRNSTAGRCGVVANVRGCHHFISNGKSSTLCAD